MGSGVYFQRIADINGFEKLFIVAQITEGTRLASFTVHFLEIEVAFDVEIVVFALIAVSERQHKLIGIFVFGMYAQHFAKFDLIDKGGGFVLQCAHRRFLVCNRFTAFVDDEIFLRSVIVNDVQRLGLAVRRSDGERACACVVIGGDTIPVDIPPNAVFTGIFHLLHFYVFFHNRVVVLVHPDLLFFDLVFIGRTVRKRSHHTVFQINVHQYVKGHGGNGFVHRIARKVADGFGLFAG